MDRENQSCMTNSPSNQSSTRYRRKNRSVSWRDHTDETDDTDATLNNNDRNGTGLSSAIQSRVSTSAPGADDDFRASEAHPLLLPDKQLPKLRSNQVEAKRYAESSTQSNFHEQNLSQPTCFEEPGSALGRLGSKSPAATVDPTQLGVTAQRISHAHNGEHDHRLLATVENLASDVRRLKMIIDPSVVGEQASAADGRVSCLPPDSHPGPGATPTTPSYSVTRNGYQYNQVGQCEVGDGTPGESLTDRHASLNSKLRASMSSLQRLAMQESLSNLRGAVHRTVTQDEVNRGRPPQRHSYPVRLSLNSFGEPKSAYRRRPPPMVPPTTPTDNHAHRTAPNAFVARAYSQPESNRVGEFRSSIVVDDTRGYNMVSHEAPPMRSRDICAAVSLKHRSKSCERY